MAKTNYKTTGDKVVIVFFFIFVSLALLSPLWVFRDLLFPYITSKAFPFRAFVELAFPFYVYLAVSHSEYRPNWKNPLVWAALGFVAANAVSTFVGVNPNRSFWGNFERMGGTYYILHLTLLALYVTCLARIGGRHIKNILYVALGVAGIITVNGIFGWLHMPTLVPDPSLPGRVSSTMGNPIYLGSFLIIPMFFSAFFALQEEENYKKILFWILSALMFAGIVLSVTRGAVVGLAAGIALDAIIYVAFNQKSQIRTYGGGVIVLFAAILALLFVFHQKLPQGGIVGRVFNLDDGNAKARLVQWKIALTGFNEKPVLGVGPENYYYLANKYYNPELIKYDPSWFDKPHNYFIEVLVTTGAVGFMVYLSMLALVFWALYKAYKTEILSLSQLCLLIAGFVAYLGQNVFVFDTIPASLMFYIFVGFVIYLLDESANNAAEPAGFAQNSRVLATASLAVAGIVSLYAVYVTNIQPAQAASAVNYGYAHANVNLEKSLGFFEQAVSAPFNFDRQDTATRFSSTISNYAESTTMDPAKAKQAMAEITDFQRQVAEEVGNDPISWQRLSSDLYIQAYFNKTGLDPEAETAIKKAVALAPLRIEPTQQLAQVYMLENRNQDAYNLLAKTITELPLTANTAEDSWILAGLDNTLGRPEDGVKLAAQLLAQKFSPGSFRDLSWVIDYYDKQKDYQTELSLAQQAVKIFPTDADVNFALVQAYAKAGQIQQAKDLANKMLQSDSPNKQAVQDYLKTLT